MPDIRGDVKTIRRDHPVFFWGLSAVLIMLLIATVAMAVRIPLYRSQAAALDESMSDAEKDVRDRILDSKAQRSELAIALLQREIRLQALEEDDIHLAISLEDSSFSLRHGDAVLRQSRVTIGPDSTIEANGQSWRLVRPLGERHVREKQRSPDLVVPDWVYASRGEAVPQASERRVEGGLGEFVLRLDDGTEIHTRPDVGPFASGAQPAAFIVEDEEAMGAIFEAISADTPVYIY